MKQCVARLTADDVGLLGSVLREEEEERRSPDSSSWLYEVNSI